MASRVPKCHICYDQSRKLLTLHLFSRNPTPCTSGVIINRTRCISPSLVVYYPLARSNMINQLLFKVRGKEGQTFYALRPHELVKTDGVVIFNYRDTLLGRLASTLTEIQLRLHGERAAEITIPGGIRFTDLNQDYPESVVVYNFNTLPPAQIRTDHSPKLTAKIRMSDDVK